MPAEDCSVERTTLQLLHKESTQKDYWLNLVYLDEKLILNII